MKDDDLLWDPWWLSRCALFTQRSHSCFSSGTVWLHRAAARRVERVFFLQKIPLQGRTTRCTATDYTTSWTRGTDVAKGWTFAFAPYRGTGPLQSKVSLHGYRGYKPGATVKVLAFTSHTVTTH